MRIIATGSAGQSMSRRHHACRTAPACAGGVTATGLSACFATVAFLRARIRGMALALAAFFGGFLARGSLGRGFLGLDFLAVRIGLAIV